MAEGLGVDERRMLARKVQRGTQEALETLGRTAGRAAIAAEVLRAGGFTAQELAAPAPNGAAARHDRLVDYQLEWALARLERDGVLTEPQPQPRSRLLRRVFAR